MIQWEYLIIEPAKKDGNPNDVNELNELGREGWGLVTVLFPGTAAEEWIFKRQLRTEAERLREMIERRRQEYDPPF